GLKQNGVEYERAARQAGVPAYRFRSLVRLATDGLVSFSSMPLRLVTRLGMISVVAALLLGAWVVAAKLFDLKNAPPQGWASTACLILLVSAVQMISLGVIGEYLARIFLEVKGRPTFLIARIVNGREGGQARVDEAQGAAVTRTQ